MSNVGAMLDFTVIEFQSLRVCATSLDSTAHPHTIFEQHRSIRGGVIDYWTNIRGSFFRSNVVKVWCVEQTVSSLVETETHQRPLTSLFRISDMLLPVKTRPLKAKFTLYSPCKNWGRMREISSQYLGEVSTLTVHVLKPERFKSNWGRISRPNLYFLTPVNITGGASEMSEWILLFRHRTKVMVYF